MSSYRVHALAHVLDRALGHELVHDLDCTRAIGRTRHPGDGGKPESTCPD